MAEPIDDGFYGNVTLEGSLVIGVNLMIDALGQQVEDVNDATFLICGDEVEGFFEIELATNSWRKFVYH